MRGGRRADRRRRSPVARPPCVVKADGLAAGKGVFVCRTQDELDAGLRGASRRSAATLVIEELLEGEEVSLFALRDGEQRVAARRRRRTSSASATATPARTPAAWARTRRSPGSASPRSTSCVETVHQPVLDGARAARHAVHRACLYAGLMLTDGRPAGARVQLPLRRPGDAGDPAAARGRPAAALLARGDAASSPASARCRRRRRGHGRARGRRLPGAERLRGTPIDGIEDAEATGALVFHAGTARATTARLVTNGGRILAVTGDRRRPSAAARDARLRGGRAGSRSTACSYRRDIALAAAEGHVRS